MKSGSDLLKTFGTDTVFDVNAIVAHVLFTVLFDEVKSVETQEELRNIERAVKGRADIVLAQLPMLGLPEHRAVMEAAFVYGAKHQFVLTKGGSLERLGIEDPDSPGSHLWFLHCREVLRQSDPCQHTTLKKPLTTLNVYTFLQLMETPLVTEASVDPSDVKTVGSHLHAPLLFLFSQRETLALDRVTAETLGWRLRGEVAVVLIHRDSADVRTPVEYNAAYRLPAEGSVIKYFNLKSIEEVVNLFREDTVQEEEEDIDEDWAVLDVLDDEVVESVYRDRDVELDVGLVTELTSDTFSKAVQESNTAVVLFFVRWDAASLAVMQSFKEVADALEDIADVQLACVDCGEWTDVCSSQLIAAFPTVRMYWSGGLPHTYTGMLGTESLLKYIMLSLAAAPVLLSSSQEVQSFLQGDLFHTQATLSPTRVVGLLSSSQDSGWPMFEGAAQALRGETLLGLFADQQAEQWAKDHNVKLPAILVFRAPDSTIKAHSLQLSSTEQLVSDIQKLLLDTFPELTVENLPLYLELRKPLLLLFLGPEGDEEQGQGLDRRDAREELHRLADTSLLDTYVPCWVHLGRTPAGRAVLESYLGSIPQLPALVLSQLASGGEVFHFPSESPLNSDTVLQWLHRVERKEEQPAGLVLDEKWGPSVPFYDFLSIMDQEVPGYAAQKTPKMTKNMVGEKGSDEEPGHSNRTPSTKKHMPQQEVPTSHQHSEF
ncbi:thioredoxin domain-containing protein 16 isoform X2 [Scleropages formosus]|uniref:thioredoxin domain-containing protein 16 isoform X2 n=1 Tax=Scleropages formosus TaxID=113540 RepID=UPI0010FA8F0A|nr:thioredoxin domain-containing protein 16 isoform X2 [Scleropages formosus]